MRDSYSVACCMSKYPFAIHNVVFGLHPAYNSSFIREQTTYSILLLIEVFTWCCCVIRLYEPLSCNRYK